MQSRAAVAVCLLLATSGAQAIPPLILPYAVQLVTYHYDQKGRLIAVVRSGTGAPDGCTGSAPTWGSGKLGCFRWGP